MSKPAVLGGLPIKSAVGEYARWPVSSESIKDGLLAVLHSGQWGTMGPTAARFEEAYAAFCTVPRCVAVSNGTKALELSFRALGVGRGDEVILPAYTFTASASAVLECGAEPVFADIDPKTYVVSASDVARRITPRTKAILCVYVGGRPGDMDALASVAEKHGLFLVEDAAQAHGSAWKGHSAGGIGVCGCFSFQASKNLPCGEGGCITTRDETLYRTLWGLRHNGRSFGDTTYDHPFLGTNVRMTEWQAAVLLAQMDRIEADLVLRMKNAAYLDEELRRFPFVEPLDKDERITRNSYHLYILRYHREHLGGLSRDHFLKALAAEHVCHAGSGYSQPIYDTEMLSSPTYEKMTGHVYGGYDGLPHTEKASREEGMWLTHSSLLGNREDMAKIVEAIARIGAYANELREW